MGRRLTAILAADVVGYSRMMGADEAGTLAVWKTARKELVDPKIAQHDGRIVKLTGDGMLVEFPSVVSAVACAVAIQGAMRSRATDLPEAKRLQLRMGMNLGDVIAEGDDIFGDGVNVAARLESIAPPGGIVISESVRSHVGNRLDLRLEDLGEQRLKNIEQPVRAFSVAIEDPADRLVTNAEKQTVSKREKPSVLVLPFANMSGDPEQEYFSDGITEDLITDLSKISGLLVAARNTAFTYKNKTVNVQQLGRDLPVGFILEGSVRKAAARVRVTGQLIDTRDGNHVWAERFDRDLTDIFAIQDEITHAIVEQLKVKLLPQEKESIGQVPTSNVEAYTFYLRGHQFLHRHSRAYYYLAKRMFSKALELDPNYAQAYAGIANCDSFLELHYFVHTETETILANTEKALALDDQLAEAHASRALALSVLQRYDEAEKEFERAVTLDPNSFEVNYLFARGKFAQGKMERAAALFERAAELKPDDYQSPILLVQVYRTLGRHAQVPEAARAGVERAKREMVAHPEDARPVYLGALALIALGDKDQAREWIARALVTEPEDVLTHYNIACAYANLGDYDPAFDVLERILPKAGAETKAWIRHDSDFDPLRQLPRYQKILELIGR